MTNEKYYSDDLECTNITDKIHSYYQNIQEDDDEEVKKITGAAVSYLMRVGCDDMSLATNEFATGIKDAINEFATTITKTLTVNMEKLK